MGIQLSVSTIKMMKSIFFACLVAAVYAEAEPKADADAYYGLGYSGVVPGYTGYALPGAYRPYAAYGAYATPTYNTYAGYTGYGYAGLRGHYIGKREAEAEAEADADAYYGYGYSNLGYGYAARSYAAPVATVARTYAAPVTTVARPYAAYGAT